MPEIQKYGKSSAGIIAQKNSFFTENDKHLETEKKIAEVYSGQAARKRCKNCDYKLGEGYDVIEVDTPYIFCDRCGHLNGRYEDSEDFHHYLYGRDEGESYGQNYSESDMEKYFDRVKTIYLPKAEFLLDVLRQERRDSVPPGFTDFGAGSGYFVAALQNLGIDAKGLEISAHQVEFANSMLGDKLLRSFKAKDTVKAIEGIDSGVLSMIGVLEHMREPRAALEAIRNNKKIEFLYISVPLFSFSVFFEKLSPDIFSRQLSGGHNHLYTRDSLRYMLDEFGFEAVGEWWFGSDMMDLYRHIDVMLERSGSSARMREMWKSSFGTVIDELQMVLDEKHLSSEVHMVLKKANSR